MLETTHFNPTQSESDPVQLEDFDYIEFYVGNAHHAAHYYRTAFGFIPIAYSGQKQAAVIVYPWWSSKVRSEWCLHLRLAPPAQLLNMSLLMATGSKT